MPITIAGVESIARRSVGAAVTLITAWSVLFTACTSTKSDTGAPSSSGGQSPDAQASAGLGGSIASSDAGDLPGSGNAGVDADAGAYPAVDGGSCLPGVPRCHGDFGYQQCEQDGTWGSPLSCAGYSSDGTSSYCVMTPGTETNEPWAACVDPACWYWITRGFVPGPTPVGICDSTTTIRQCNAGGTLSEETCSGVCTQIGVLDGRRLGYCNDQCIAGARECLGGSVYRECREGRWLAEPLVCEGAAVCNPLGSGAVPDVRCGGSCDPGTSRCASDGTGIERCNEDQVWETGPSCLVGTCRPAGPQAQCQAECSTDELDCAVVGASMQRSCSDLRQWTEPTPCPDMTSCRMSSGQSLGCVECLGPSTSGNEYGVSDSRCDVAGVVHCGEGNTWLPPLACQAGETCVELRFGSSSVAYCQP